LADPSPILSCEVELIVLGLDPLSRIASRYGQLARAKLQHQEVDSVQRTALHPRDEIIGVARALSADLLVISTHGYTGWKHFLFGSDAEKILEHACCPTLVVRSNGTIGSDHSTS
jgi:nucleotide-binding universal stress UspA family protein